MEIAIIGLGKMGGALALKALEENIKVVGMTFGEVPEYLAQKNFSCCTDLTELIASTTPPRRILLYIPAGLAVEVYLQQMKELLTAGDIIIDGGNSYWGDSILRARELEKKGLHFLDMGTSGGISGARVGACFMVGGKRSAYEEIEPILKRLAGDEAYGYMGPSGSGHLVKLIHNGIEFGMLQAIGEGMALLEKFNQEMPLEMNEVLKVYQNGSVIRSWLIDLMAEQFSEQQGFSSIASYIEDTGEVNWLIHDALYLEVPIPVISQSVMELLRSRDQERIDYRSVAMMRHGFGGHPFGANEYLKKERHNSRISHEFPLPPQQGETHA